MITVAAVVVTRNRPALLKRCLEAIDSQTYPVSQLVVLDNASDEPTREFLAGEVCSAAAPTFTRFGWKKTPAAPAAFTRECAPLCRFPARTCG